MAGIVAEMAPAELNCSTTRSRYISDKRGNMTLRLVVPISRRTSMQNAERTGYKRGLGRQRIATPPACPLALSIPFVTKALLAVAGVRLSGTMY